MCNIYLLDRFPHQMSIQFRLYIHNQRRPPGKMGDYLVLSPISGIFNSPNNASFHELINRKLYQTLSQCLLCRASRPLARNLPGNGYSSKYLIRVAMAKIDLDPEESPVQITSSFMSWGSFTDKEGSINSDHKSFNNVVKHGVVRRQQVQNDRKEIDRWPTTVFLLSVSVEMSSKLLVVLSQNILKIIKAVISTLFCW
jgi:hypothetical protein